MISLLVKYWRLIIDILLVFALVILLFWWNPMGIFGGGLRLEDTSNLVTEVNEIQELVTAEYYGEVISSIEEARLNPLEEEEIKNQVALLYGDLLVALQNLRDFQDIPVDQRVDEYREGEKTSSWRRKVKHDVDSRNILDKLEYLESLEELTIDPYYSSLVGFLWRHLDGKNLDDLPSDRDIGATLLVLYRNPALHSVLEKNWGKFMEDFYYQFQESLSRRESRKKLTMIGRGWVKAGFDFSELGPESIVYYKESGIVHLIGIAPKILNADINPWFVPEKGIPGFQILDDRGPVDFHDAKRVKQYCIEKLTVQAYQARILENAHQQGQETLKAFFSLVTGNKIEQVIFHSSPFTSFAREVGRDELITYAEAFMLDSLLELEVRKIDSLSSTVHNRSVNGGFADENRKVVKQLLKDLGRYPYQEGSYPFGFFSKLTTDIAADSLLDRQEVELLKQLRYSLDFGDVLDEISLKDSSSRVDYWVESAFDYCRQYNEMITQLKEGGVLPEPFDTVRVVFREFHPENYLDSVRLVSYGHIDTDSIELIYSDRLAYSRFYQGLFYPFEPKFIDLEHFIGAKGEGYDSVIYPKSRRLPALDSGVWIYDQKVNDKYAYKLTVKPESMLAKALYRELTDERLLYTSDTAYFGIGRQQSLPVDSLDSQGVVLSQFQTAELQAFVRTLLRTRQQEQNKGFVQKTTDWLKSRASSSDPKNLYVGKKGIWFQE
ncbi:hypothetical protein DN752_19350 [Echinicola strongylocentroti]|uniref:Uncharacterized protein n=1 Tax=Echinicola strongylocentroti TaxID=1795355 RepID=A0A2Z4IN08_9BACT|nr:DUF4230 domain-containing protein [Echinicola strongylocentroti]AWW32120.1 hypothetical protein DN752_19350 [Echinicola strongylocentroti]